MNYFNIYRDIWDWHRKYIDKISDDSEFWKMLVDEGKAIVRKYDNCQFATELFYAELHEFSRLHKGMKEGDNNG